MKTAQDVLEFISEYADFTLMDAEKENNDKKARKKYTKYAGMRELINAVIDEMDTEKK